MQVSLYADQEQHQRFSFNDPNKLGLIVRSELKMKTPDDLLLMIWIHYPVPV
jgi:hypothetical protein